ncbi:Amino acid transporter, transmembrane domain [Dillenia turbinata]|uniref:Amino acid transporter, transmembrane domain n=1 Tax=Dillenia turbinata TaxID=194707 RepID=A0AAN8ZM43_9MAGN
MGEVVDMKMGASSPAITAPPFQLQNSPSMTRSPLIQSATKNPKSPLTPRFMMTPVASPMKKALKTMQTYMEEVGHLTKLNPQDAWLPITESQEGNAFYAAFHSLNSGIGFQALVLPLAFAQLGWTWGILSLLMAFIWQLYTLWLLIQLHESVSGTRYSRYLGLSMAAFGEKLGKLLALFPIMYLSGGTCVTLIMIGGGTLKILFSIVCDDRCNTTHPLSTIEWYLVFVCFAIALAQLPNLNSVAGVSLIGSITAVTYCTLISIISIVKGRPTNISDGPLGSESDLTRLRNVLNALGVIAFAFRGHNLVLEIQSTMPSSLKNPSRVPMWRGVKIAYSIIASCLFPLAICGYWAYGNLIQANEGMFKALYKYHGHDASRFLLGLTSTFIIVNCLSSFQIYAMPVFDNLESRYTSNMNRPCPRWLRTGIRLFFGCLALFISVALPFLLSLAAFIGGIALPITLAYPCFMWLRIRKPPTYSANWFLNCILGSLGIVLSILVVCAAIWSIVDKGIEIHFFHPK